MSQNRMKNYYQLSKLKQEDLDAAEIIRNQRKRNMLAVFLLGLAIGIGLGYTWRMKHSNRVSQIEVKSPQAFVPYDCIVPDFLLRKKGEK